MINEFFCFIKKADFLPVYILTGMIMNMVLGGEICDIRERGVNCWSKIFEYLSVEVVLCTSGRTRFTLEVGNFSLVQQRRQDT